MKEQGLIHVGIAEPEKVRRVLLEAARATISCLQRYEKFSGVREEKQKVIEDFANIFGEESYTFLKSDNNLHDFLSFYFPPDQH